MKIILVIKDLLNDSYLFLQNEKNNIHVPSFDIDEKYSIYQHLNEFNQNFSFEIKQYDIIAKEDLEDNLLNKSDQIIIQGEAIIQNQNQLKDSKIMFNKNRSVYNSQNSNYEKDIKDQNQFDNIGNYNGNNNYRNTFSNMNVVNQENNNQKFSENLNVDFNLNPFNQNQNMGLNPYQFFEQIKNDKPQINNQNKITIEPRVSYAKFSHVKQYTSQNNIDQCSTKCSSKSDTKIYNIDTNQWFSNDSNTQFKFITFDEISDLDNYDKIEQNTKFLKNLMIKQAKYERKYNIELLFEVGQDNDDQISNENRKLEIHKLITMINNQNFNGIIKLLKQFEQDINTIVDKHSGKSLMHKFATQVPYKQFLEFLEFNPNIMQLDAKGRSIMHQVTQYYPFDILEFILRLKMNMKLPNEIVDKLDKDFENENELNNKEDKNKEQERRKRIYIKDQNQKIINDLNNFEDKNGVIPQEQFYNWFSTFISGKEVKVGYAENILRAKRTGQMLSFQVNDGEKVRNNGLSVRSMMHQIMKYTIN